MGVALAAIILLFVYEIYRTYNSPLRRKIDINAINLPKGYKIEAIAANLSVPTTGVFDGEDFLVAESGFDNTAKPRVIKIKRNGTVETVVEEGLMSPVTGLLIINKELYISHRSKVSKLVNGKLVDIITDLPSMGDHQNNNIVLGPDGKIYIGQGTVTNSGVVGVDNYNFGWLTQHTKMHDVPCRDIVLRGQNFETESPFQNGEKITTGAYLSYGTPSTSGQIIEGNVKCNGSVLRFNPDGSNIEVVAWGLRNPYGLSFDALGQLWVSYHGADVRGSRPIFNDPDYLVKIEEGQWYGWPDFFDGRSVEDTDFHAPTEVRPRLLLQNHPPLSKPYMVFPSHVGANGHDFSKGGVFGQEGHLFIAMYGTFTIPTAGVNVGLYGFQVAKVNLQSKKHEPFVSNKLPGPSYINQTGGLNRPSDIIFSPDSSMYIVDWGATGVNTEGIKNVERSGVVWRVYSAKQQALRSQGPIMVQPATIPQSDQEPLLKFSWSLLWDYLTQILIVVFIAATVRLIFFVLSFTIWKKREKIKEKLKR